MKNYRSYRGNRPQSPGKKALTAVLALLLAGVLIFGVLLGVVISGERDQLQGDPHIMIILGCQVKPWGPSILLQDRLDEALEYLDDHPDMTVVVTGGKGTDEIMSEAQAMHDYLVERGFPSEQILLEDRAASTVENILFSMELLAEEGYDVTEDMVVVSNGFHLARTRMLWKRICGGDYNLSTLAAPSSHKPSRIKMYFREPLVFAKAIVFDR